MDGKGWYNEAYTPEEYAEYENRKGIRTSPAKRERAVSTQQNGAWSKPGFVQPPPDTQMQALLEAAPGETPRLSKQEMLPLKETIADAIDALPDKQKWVFEAKHYRGLSIRKTAAELNLSKSYVHRLYHKARAELRKSLEHVV